MSDTTSAAPSDAEIEALAAEHLKSFAQFVGAGDVWVEGEVAFARAVLAKWGTPQPPNPQAVNLADRPFIVRLAEDFADDCVNAGYVTTNAASYGRLIAEAVSTHAQPTQAQAGAVPLNHKNIEPVRRFLADRGIYLSDETTKALITVAHGIKGGQHGAE